MIKILIAVFGILLIYWVYKKKKDFLIRRETFQPIITEIKANVLEVYLDWDTPLICLQKDGTKYGKIFKEKIPPTLPHNSKCNCQIVTEFYNSSDIFNKNSNINKKYNSSLGKLDYESGKKLKKILIKSFSKEKDYNVNELIKEFELKKFSIDKKKKLVEIVKKAFEENS